MVAYKLSKKYWVMHFFAIFRFVREKLLVTVALDHPVAQQIYNQENRRKSKKQRTKVETRKIVLTQEIQLARATLATA